MRVNINNKVVNRLIQKNNGDNIIMMKNIKNISKKLKCINNSNNNNNNNI